MGGRGELSYGFASGSRTSLRFFAIKLGMGVVACAVLLYGSDNRLAKIGVRLGLAAYSVAIVSHILTGFAVSGYLS